MIALYRFALSPIDDPSISYHELAAYASDHNQRMSAQNPGGNALSARIAATATALTAFHDTRWTPTSPNSVCARGPNW